MSRNRCFLLVDNDDLVRDAVALMLEHEGVRVIEAAAAGEAIALIQGGLEVDALVTDVDLGAGLNGAELADTVHEMQPELRVIFITGRFASLADRAADPRETILYKPFASEALSRAIKLMLID